ncbi:phage tail assembly protein T [Singulisphaera rosea]
MTVRELLSRIGSDELSEWLAFDDLEPLPNGYLQTGILASTIANVMGSGKKKFAPIDFMPGRRTATPRQSDPEKGIAVMRGLMARQNVKGRV